VVAGSKLTACQCYVYLPDLAPSAAMPNGLGQCRWFTRGWSLQELIAPTDVLFLDANWKIRGTKGELVEYLAKITGINMDILLHKKELKKVCVAQKMYWASNKETSRAESMAYCLLGIFGVRMPIKYGEGGNMAFRRLQHVIIQSKGDTSIFAWRLPANMGDLRHTSDPVSPPNNVHRYSGMLAESPREFSHCRGMEENVGCTMKSDMEARTN